MSRRAVGAPDPTRDMFDRMIEPKVRVKRAADIVTPPRSERPLPAPSDWSFELIDQYHTHHGPNTPVTINGPTHRASARVGPSSVERVFGIYGMVVREASTSLTPYARNLTNSGKSWMTAVAR